MDKIKFDVDMINARQQNTADFGTLYAKDWTHLTRLSDPDWYTNLLYNPAPNGTKTGEGLRSPALGSG